MMDDDNDDDLEMDTFAWVNFSFKSTRITGNFITSHNSDVKVEIHTSPDIGELDLTIALEKIHYWFDNIVSRSVMFSRENPYALRVMFDDEGRLLSDNLPFILPDDPSDDLLAMVIQSKLNAMAGEHILFGDVEIKSDTKERLTSLFIGLAEIVLPDMNEWVGERAYHNKPWWGRDDGSIMDMVPAPEADLSKAPYDFSWDFIENKYRKAKADSVIIIKPDFKPRVIDGGKDDGTTQD